MLALRCSMGAPMVSRRFLIEQACINALEEFMPVTIQLHGAAATWKWCAALFVGDTVPNHWLEPIRKHFAILDRRERAASDVIRLDTWREAAGIK